MTEFRLRDYVQTLFGLLLLGSLLVLVDFSKVLNEVLRTDLRLYALATFLFFSTYAATAKRWKNLANSVGEQLSLKDSLKTVSVAYGFNQLLPGNSGDIARSKIMENYTEVESHSSLLGAVALERFYDALVVTAVVVVAANFVAPAFTASAAWLVKLFTAALILFVAAVGFMEYSGRRISFLPERVADALENFHSGVTSSSKLKTLENLLLTSYKWIAEIAVFYILAVSLDLNLGAFEAAFVTSSMSLVSSLPITPAGVGPVEITGVGLLAVSGMASSSSASLVILQRSIGVLLTALLGTAVYLSDFRGRALKSR
ncbi:MAG: YbhN family protein [Candidatus Nanohaloarchaea archaeon]